MKRVFYKWTHPDSINDLINDLIDDQMPYLSNIKWHPTDFKVKITIERVKETKK